MTPHQGKSNRKSAVANDILALHAVMTLPDSIQARRRLLAALLAACPKSQYAESISVMLEHLEQHRACAEHVQNLKSNN